MLGATVRCGHKTTPHEGDPEDLWVTDSPTDALDRLTNGELDVLGGTAWLWARADAIDSVDVLFVDEAGQMSLANVLAASQASRNLVLLGDPQQLEQPQKGSHPDGVDVSSLDHVLGGAHTMPDDRGIFLPVTWRLAPAICKFTSEVFYDGRLVPLEGLEHQRLGLGLALETVVGLDRQQVRVVELAGQRALDAGVGIRDGHEADLAALPG